MQSRVTNLALSCAIVAIALRSSGDEPAAPESTDSRPQWQRLLTGDDAKQVESLSNRIKELDESADYSAAVGVAEELYKLRSRVQGADHWESISAYWDLDGFRKAAALPEEDRKEYASIVKKDSEAVTAYRRGEYARAELLMQESLDIFTRVFGNDHAHTASSANNLGAVLNEQRKFSDARPHLESALKIRRHVLGEGHPHTGTSYNNLGHNLSSQGLLDQAEPYLREAAQVARRVHGPVHFDLAMAYTNLGICVINRARYADAQPLLAESLAIMLQTIGGNDPRTANAYNNLAYLLNAQARFAEAQPLYDRALEIRRRLLPKTHPLLAMSFNNAAENLAVLNQFDKAAPLYQEAIDLYRENGDKLREAQIKGNFVRVHFARGNLAEAEETLRQALAVIEVMLPPNDPECALIFNNLAYVLAAQGEFNEAAKWNRKTLDVRRQVLGEGHPLVIGTHGNIALSLLAEGNLVEAGNAARAAAGSFELARMNVARGGLERASFGAAFSPYDQLAVIEAQQSKPVSAWQAMEAGLARGLLDDAAARSAADSSRRDRSRRAALVAEIAQIEPQVRQLVMTPQLTAEQSTALDGLLARRAQAEQELTRIAAEFSRRQLSEIDEIQGALPDRGAWLCWVDYVSKDFKLSKHWACIIRKQGEPEWVELSGAIADDALTDAKSRLPNRLRESLADASARDQVPELVRQLASQRLEPLLPHLEEIDRLYIASANEMAGVPIEALTDRFTVSYIPSGTQLVRLRNAPRPPDDEPARLLALGDPVFAPPVDEPTDAPASDAVAKDDSPAGENLLASLTRAKVWPPLPGSREEIQQLARHFPDEHATMLAQSEASEQRLAELAASGELSKYRYIHLATHGEAIPDKAFESALILAQDRLPTAEDLAAGAKFYDGRLTANEVLETWKLNADLVTLSSCESGLGLHGGGEGFLGFAQALLLAGARSVCLSLWQVDDTATALLMDRFYHNLLAERMGKAAALAEAKGWLRGLTAREAEKQIKRLAEDGVRGPKGKVKVGKSKSPPDSDPESHPYEHPRYWAAFILIGDDE